MPYKKVPCPECGQPKSKRSKLCKNCSKPYTRTKSHRNNMAKKLKGRQMRGVGWQHNKTTRKKMASHWTPERRAEKSLEQKLIYENYENRMAIALALVGEKNPNYQGKGKKTPYGPGYSGAYARMIRNKRGKCENCKKTNCYLHLHHKDFGKTNHRPENLSCLCCSCHRKVHAEHKKSQTV